MSLPPFQAVLDAHRQDVYRFLVGAVGMPDADDCFQETFLSALRAYPRVRPDSNIKAWLLTIARNKAIDVHRAKSRLTDLDSVPDPAVDAQLNDHLDIGQEVRRLPSKQRAAIAYRYGNDLAYRDIAGLMGTSEGAARQNVRQGLRKLREVYSDG